VTAPPATALQVWLITEPDRIRQRVIAAVDVYVEDGAPVGWCAYWLDGQIAAALGPCFEDPPPGLGTWPPTNGALIAGFGAPWPTPTDPTADDPFAETP